MTDQVKFLNELRQKNKQRIAEWPGSEKAELPHKMLELFGEAGELANEIKKLYRIDQDIMGTVEDRETIIQNIKDEAGDVLICLDLLLNELDMDLEVVTREKFNKTSIKHGLKTRL